MKDILKDIESAYLAEQDYIINNLGREVNLLDILKQYDYETLDEYFGDRFLYLLNKKDLKTEYYTLENWATTKMLEKMKAGANGIFFPANSGSICALVGEPEYFDYDKAKELGVVVCNLGYNGGTIITEDSDFNLSMLLPLDMNLLPNKFLEEFNKFFIRKGYNTRIDRNDILLEDGKKIAGSVFAANNLCGNFSISISLNDHTELIEQLCKKKSEKIPGYLTGITREEIEEEVLSWL